jgi:Ca-activated chloride channel family protein
VRTFTVGLGDRDHGARIPDTESKRGGFVEYEGEQVWSKMNGQVLRQIATETNGAYIPAGTKRVDMGDVYHRYVANVEQAEFESAKINAYIPRFQWFAVPALVLLLLEMFVSTRRMRSRAKMSERAYPVSVVDDPMQATSDVNASQAA